MIFLSHAGADSGAAKELADGLRAAGLEVWLDRERIDFGDVWMDRIQEGLEQATGCVVYVGSSGIQNWVGTEVRIALDRSQKEPGFRIVPVLGPGADPDTLDLLLKQYQYVDLRDGLTARSELGRLFAEALAPREQARPVLPPDQAPFRGLRHFDTKHSLLFFGREREIEDLLERLRRGRVLAVVGDSGSGKSSLVRAGLIPALLQGRFHESGSWAESWRVAVLRPGEAPFRGLADGLLGLEPDLSSPADRIELRATLSDELREGAKGLRQIVSVLVPATTRTLVVVDQFEEIFGEGIAAEERQRFIDTLLDAATAPEDRPIHVVLTLRSDFYPACLKHAELAESLAANQYIVRRAGKSQLREIIEGPLALARARAEDGLVERMVEEVGVEPGNLALLEHALEQLWENRSGDRLTHQAYQAMGRIEGALEHQAEQLFGKLSETEQAVARRLFMRLTRVTQDAPDTRRRVPRALLVEAAGQPELAGKVLDRLVAAHLVVGAAADESREPEHEVAHEALIRGWSRLRGWLDEDRGFELWRQQLGADAREWERRERDPEVLYGGGRLAEAARWSEERPEDLVRERDFIDAALGVQRSRRLRRLLLLVATGVAVLVVAAVFWVQGMKQRAQAEELRFRALLMAAPAAAAEDPLIAALLLTELPADYGSPEAPRIARRLLADSPQIPRAVLGGFDQRIRSVAFAGECGSAEAAEPGRPGPIPAGCRIVTLDVHDRLRVQPTDGRGSPDVAERGVQEVVVSPDGSRMALVLRGGKAEIRSIEGDGRTEVPLAGVASIAFRPGGGVLAITSEGLQALDRDFEELAGPVEARGVAASQVSSSDGAWALVAGSRVIVFRPDGSAEPLVHAQEVQKALLSSDGSSILTTSGGRAALWRLETRPEGTKEAILPEVEDLLKDAAISPDADFVLTGWDAKIARLARFDGDDATVELRGHTGPLVSVAVSTDGSLVATVADRAVRVWSVEPLSEPVRVGGPSAFRNQPGVAIDPDSDRARAVDLQSVAAARELDPELWRSLQPEESELRQATYSLSGDYILTVQKESPGTVRIFEAWEPWSKVDELGAEATGSGGKVVHAASDGQDRFVYGAVWDGEHAEIWRWRLGWQALRELLREHTTAELSERHRERFLAER